MLERSNALLIAGLPGSNRHRLGTEIVNSAQHTGLILHVLCTVDDIGNPHALLRHVLADLGGDPDTAAEDLLTHIRQRIRADHDTAPTLLIQDATFAAPQSLAALSTLATSNDLRIITTMTPASIPLAPEFAAAAERIDLEPLTPHTITRLLTSRFGGAPHDVLVGFLHERSQGGYASLCEVADLMAECGAIVEVDGTVILRSGQLERFRLTLPEHRRSTSASRLGGNAKIVDLIDLVSLIGEVDANEAIACTNAATVQLTTDHGPIRHIDSVLTMVDPVEAEAVVAALDAARMAELWDAYAGGLHVSMNRPESAIRSARWHIETGNRLPAALTQLAAHEANDRGLHARVAVMTQQERTSASPVEVQHQRAYALQQTGDSAALHELLQLLDPATIPTHEVFAFARWALPLVPEQDRETFTQKLIGTPSDRTQREAAVALAGMFKQAFLQVSGTQIRQVRSLVFSGSLSPIDTAMAHTVLAASLRHAGRPGEAVQAGRTSVDLLESLAGVGAPELDTARETLFMSLIAAQDLDAAAEVLHSYQAKCVRYGRAGRLGLIMSGILEFHRGRTNRGLASLRLLLDDQANQDALHFNGWVETLAAQGLIGIGHLDEAELMLADAEAQPLTGLRQSDLERRLTEAFVHDSLADPDRALEILAEVARDARTHGLTLVELDALGLAVLVDGPGQATALVEAVSQLTEPLGTPAMWHAFAPLAASYDFPGLIALVDELLSDGQLTYASRFAQFTLDSGRRATDLTPEQRRRLDAIAHSELPGR